MPNYCGVPTAVGELYNYQPSFQGYPLGEWAHQDPRIPRVPTNRSWVSQGENQKGSPKRDSSVNDPGPWSVVAPESEELKYVQALRGVDNQLYTSQETWNRDIETETLRIHNSLGREYWNNTIQAVYRTGGIGYAYDNTSPTGIHWASSPGYKGDAYDPRYNPQIYMRPGVQLAQGFSSLGAVPPGQLPSSLYGSGPRG